MRKNIQRKESETKIMYGTHFISYCKEVRSALVHEHSCLILPPIQAYAQAKYFDDP